MKTTNDVNKATQAPMLTSSGSIPVINETPRRSFNVPFGLTEKANFLTLPAGNDPAASQETLDKIHDVLKENSPDGHFIFVGTCGLRTLDWIISVAKIPSPTVIPKLYIIDFSEHVKTFWTLMKKVMTNAETYEQFDHELERCAQALRDCCYKGYDPLEAIKWAMDSMTARQGNYSYLRAITLKATICVENWANKRIFEVINLTRPKDAQGNWVPAIVDIGNIFELTGRNFCNGEQLITAMESNINLLDPLFSIHTRTTLEKSNERKAKKQGDVDPNDFVFHPTEYLIFEKKHRQESGYVMNKLNDEKYVPLLSYPIVFPPITPTFRHAAAKK